MAEIRDRLMRGIAIDMAFEGDYGDMMCIGPPDGDCDAEYFILYFASHLGPEEGTGNPQERALQLERSRQSMREEFQRLAKEHHDTTLTKAELNWLMRKAGAIVIEESASGMVDVDFYGNFLELERAWKHQSGLVNEVNREEYGRYPLREPGHLPGHVHVEPHFKIRRD